MGAAAGGWTQPQHNLPGRGWGNWSLEREQGLQLGWFGSGKWENQAAGIRFFFSHGNAAPERPELTFPCAHQAVSVLLTADFMFSVKEVKTVL